MREELNEAFGLEGRVAVVTGAGSGIGRETARVFAMAGAQVALVDVNEQGLRAAAADIEAVGGRAFIHPVDVSKRDQVERLADEVVETAGRLDVWVNAAAILLRVPILQMSEAELDRILSINLKGVWFGVQAAGRVMCAAGRGSIVNVASAGADMPAPEISAYAMTKAAVNMLTRDAATEFGPSGVRVNSVAPGWVDTAMTAFRFEDAGGKTVDAAGREAVLAGLAQGSPLGKTGVPRDIAMGMLYLASDASAFVTGQVLRVNGGVAMP